LRISRVNVGQLQLRLKYDKCRRHITRICGVWRLNDHTLYVEKKRQPSLYLHCKENKFDIKHARNSANRAKIERDQRYVIVLLSCGGNVQTALRERDANGVSRDEVQNLQRSSWFSKFC